MSQLKRDWQTVSAVGGDQARCASPQAGPWRGPPRDPIVLVVNPSCALVAKLRGQLIFQQTPLLSMRRRTDANRTHLKGSFLMFLYEDFSEK